MTTERPSGVAASEARPFDAVLCDVDNVIRFYDTTALARLEREAGLAEGATARVAFTPEVDRPLMLGAVTPERWAGLVAEALAGQVTRRTAQELGAALAGAPFTADEEVVALLRRARAHVPVILVSNASLELENDLASLGLDDLAEHAVNSARVGVIKPDPRIYGIAVARAGVAAERCLFVDDRRANVEAAVALGMSGVHHRGAADLRAALHSLLDG